jgi:hypothetical protein
MKNTLYALLVGINDYPAHINQLNGCVPDTERVAQYLHDREGSNYNLKIVTRHNEKATRATVINDFKTHLAAAKDDDVVLFYYSGHGAQEKADPSVWKAEPNKKLEGLALFDSIPAGFKNCKLLADKELRYLLTYITTHNERGESKNKTPHIVVITDCCHSGENTRGLAADDGLKERLIEEVLDQRPWKDFVFASDPKITPQLLAINPVNRLFPLTPHVAMAACRANERAKETPFGGVFTSNLMDILDRSQGVVTYRDLQNRIKNYLKNQYTQIPQIYASTDKSDLFHLFLGKNGGSKPFYANVVFNQTDGWVMDMGAMQGMSNQAKGVKIVSFDGTLTLDATIAKIASNHTTLTVAEADKLDNQAQYKGMIDGFLSAPIGLFIDNLDGNAAMEQALRDVLTASGKNINIVPKEDLSDYALRIFDGKYVITNRVDTDEKVRYKPLVMPTANVDLVFSDINQISQFEYVKNLENSGDNTLSLDKVTISFLEKGKTTPTPIEEIKGEEFVNIPYWAKDANGFPYGEISISVTNNDAKPLYVSLLCLSTTFGVTTDFFSAGVQLLEQKGSTVKVWDGEWIDLNYEPHTQIFNNPSSDSLFKLIVSRQPFDVTPFEMVDLPTPLDLFDNNKTKRGEEKEKAIGRKKNASTDEGDAWVTRTITMRNPNPVFDAAYRNKPSRFNEWLATDGGAYLKKLY